jgi:hypothetical protein
MIDSEQIPSAQRARALGHLEHTHPTGVGGRDQRADARAREEHGFDPALLQSSNDADMGEPLEAAAAKDECDAFDLRLLSPFSYTSRGGLGFNRRG